MSKKLQVTNGRVQCPIDGRITVRSCKKCEHCRIYINDTVKCSYEKDIYNILHPNIHVYNI